MTTPHDETAGSMPTTPHQPANPDGTTRTDRRGMFGVSGSGDVSGYGGLVVRPTVQLSAEKPYGGWFDEMTDALERAYPAFSDAILRVVVDRGELTLHVKRDKLLEVAQVLRDDPALRFEVLANLCGTDYPGEPERLHVVYNLLSMTYRRRVRLEVAAPESDPHVPSVVSLWATADWQERETYDFFGVVFDGHPHLTRIQMPDDWDGFPQRKDYPLGGVPVEYKGAQIPPPDERRSYA
jgi:NADH-quinone oxidoreductase subunit C